MVQLPHNVAMITVSNSSLSAEQPPAAMARAVHRHPASSGHRRHVKIELALTGPVGALISRGTASRLIPDGFAAHDLKVAVQPLMSHFELSGAMQWAKSAAPPVVAGYPLAVQAAMMLAAELPLQA